MFLYWKLCLDAQWFAMDNVYWYDYISLMTMVSIDITSCIVRMFEMYTN